MKKIKSDLPEKLSLAHLSNLDKINDETEIVTLAGGKYQLEINKFFRNTQLQRLIADLIEAVMVVRKETSSESGEDINTMFLIRQTLIIKHFTNLGLKNLDCSKKKDIEKLLAVAKQLMDSGIFSELMGAFPESELNKLEEAIKLSTKASEQIGELFVRVEIAERERLTAEAILESEQIEHNESEGLGKDFTEQN